MIKHIRIIRRRENGTWAVYALCYQFYPSYAKSVQNECIALEEKLFEEQVQKREWAMRQ